MVISKVPRKKAERLIVVERKVDDTSAAAPNALVFTKKRRSYKHRHMAVTHSGMISVGKRLPAKAAAVAGFS